MERRGAQVLPDPTWLVPPWVLDAACRNVAIYPPRRLRSAADRELAACAGFLERSARASLLAMLNRAARRRLLLSGASVMTLRTATVRPVCAEAAVSEGHAAV